MNKRSQPNKKSHYLYFKTPHFSHLFASHYLEDFQLLDNIPFHSQFSLCQSITVQNSSLIVPPFKIRQNSQIYINPLKLDINFEYLKPYKYKVIIVHNFQAEDPNPNLNECLAGIFFAHNYEAENWQKPENIPFECRQIKTLGLFESMTGEFNGIDNKHRETDF